MSFIYLIVDSDDPEAVYAPYVISETFDSGELALAAGRERMPEIENDILKVDRPTGTPYIVIHELGTTDLLSTRPSGGQKARFPCR